MLFNRAIVTFFLLSSSAAAFNVDPSGGKKVRAPPAAAKNIANVLAAGVISAATLLPHPGPAMAVDNLVLGTTLETKLAKFGEVSYPVFNSIKDVSPLVEKTLALVDTKVKGPDSAEVAQKAVDGLLAIPDSKINEYRGVLRQFVYKDVSKDNCVTLGGSGSALQKVQESAAVKSVDPGKIDALKKKFRSANEAVPLKDGNICLPGSVAASEKLWVAQADLTLSMPKTEATALVASIKKAGAQFTRPTIATLVPSAEGIFSKNAEAIRMVAAGKDVEPAVIKTVNEALK